MKNRQVTYDWCGYASDDKSDTPYTVRRTVQEDYCKVASKGEALSLIQRLTKAEEKGI